jgi:hypothetical protein
MTARETPDAHSEHGRLALRILGALLLLLVGADHYYEYSVDNYSVLPTIGVLFLLNFVSATTLGLLLLAPLEKLFHRFGAALTAILAASGFIIAATSLVALIVSEHTPLFGFMESNYRTAIVVAIASEASAAIFLVPYALLATKAAHRRIRPRAADQVGGTRATHPAVHA